MNHNVLHSFVFVFLQKIEEISTTVDSPKMASHGQLLTSKILNLISSYMIDSLMTLDSDSALLYVAVS